MKRRKSITLLGGVMAWPLAAGAQQLAKLPTIGFLGQSTPAVGNQRLAAFSNRLRELGWIEGRTVAIQYGWGEGSSEQFAKIATEFVRHKVDVIVTSGTANVVAAKQASINQQSAKAVEDPQMGVRVSSDPVNFWMEQRRRSHPGARCVVARHTQPCILTGPREGVFSKSGGVLH